MGLQDTSAADDDRISIIADALRATYGDAAISVAERQLDAAEANMRSEWIAILDYLGSGSA